LHLAYVPVFFFSSRRRHTRFSRDWSSDVCSSDLTVPVRTSGTMRLASDLLRMDPQMPSPTWMPTPFSVNFTLRAQGTSAGRCARSEERRVGKEGRDRRAYSG